MDYWTQFIRSAPVGNEIVPSWRLPGLYNGDCDGGYAAEISRNLSVSITIFTPQYVKSLFKETSRELSQ